MEETKYILEWFDSWYEEWNQDEDFESKQALDAYYHRLQLHGCDMKLYRKVILTVKREVYE